MPGGTREACGPPCNLSASIAFAAAVVVDSVTSTLSAAVDRVTRSANSTVRIRIKGAGAGPGAAFES